MIVEERKERVWRERAYRYAPFLLFIALILFFSTGEGSMVRTSLFVRPLLEFLFPDANEAALVLYHGFIRKLAHLTEYACLGITAARAFRTSSKKYLSSYWPFSSLFAVIMVAAIDETNQSFNPARTGSSNDVLIDFAGGVIGLTLFSIFLMMWNSRIKDDKDGFH